MTDEELVKQLRDEALDLHRSAWRDISGGQNATISATLADTTADRIEQLTAERDRLRVGIEYILDGYGLAGPDYRFPYGEEEADWITDHLIAALKGESHE